MDTFLRVVIKKPWVVLAVTVLVTLLLGVGLKNASLSSDFRLYFSEDNPQMLAFESLEADFNKTDSLIFLIEAERGIYDQKVLRYIDSLVDEAWKLPFSRRVDAITNFPRTITEADELVTDYLVPGDFSYSESAITKLKEFVSSDIQARQYVSADSTVAVVNVSLSLPDDDKKATNRLVSRVREMVESEVAKPDGVSVQLIGTAIVNLALEEAVKREASFLVPLSYLLVFGSMWLLIRVGSGVVLTLGVITLTNIVAFGGFVWLGGILTPAVSPVPNMIIIIAVADCMHLLVSYYHYLREYDKDKALDTALRINFKPMLVTSVTTAVGLLCLNFSESPPYRDLGNMVAFGAMFAFLLTITFVPAFLAILPVPKRISSKSEPYMHEKLVFRLGEWITNHSLKLMVISALLVCFFVSHIADNELSDNWEGYYDETFAVKRALNTQKEKLYGTRFIEYKVDSGRSQGIFDPAYMKSLDRLVEWLRQQPETGSVTAFSDQIKEIHRTLHDNDRSYYRVPDNRELLAQTVLLYEMSLPYGMGIEERVNIDKSATRLSLQLYSMTSKEIIAFDRRVQDWVGQNASNLEISEGTGLDIVFANISQRNTESLAKGTVIALVVISLILILILKSLKLGILSLIPNLVPAAMAYGLWGMLVGRVDMALSIVGTMSLGLVVDDTVHFLSKYQYARNKLGKTVHEAIEFAFKTVGVAMLVTTIVLAGGFGILFVSHFQPTASMGSLLAITIVFALIVDFILLPGLLILFDRKKHTEQQG